MRQICEACRRIFNPIRQFDNDENGIESIQVVMILAFAAVVMTIAWLFWTQIWAWAILKIAIFTSK